MMRKSWWTAVALALLLAAPAWSATEVVDGQRVPGANTSSSGPPSVIITGGIVDADTTAQANRMDTSGNQYVREAFPQADANAQHTQIINSASIAYNAGDSSAVLDVHGLRHMKLLVKATLLTSAGLGDSSQVGRLVFNVRTHLNGQADSSSTFSEYAFGVTPQGVNVTGGDTLHVGHLLEGGRNGPWSGEFVVTVSQIRLAKASTLALNGNDWYYPSGIAIPLDSVMGRDFWSDYLSIRVRNIGPSVAPIAVTVHLIGTPL